MKTVGIILLVVLAGFVILDAQTPDARLQGQLKQLFPAASAFSGREGDPPHFKAFAGGRAPQNVIGYAFWTTDLQPLERGYDGPIKTLVGLDTKGVITGIIITEHHEPYGDFSIDLPAFPQQFRGKDVRDAFRVGNDIAAVSRATITVTSATRAIRNSARRVARQLLTPPGNTQ
jgi:NosR/NirI family nitrous oxide reductase transcriptional regulator